MNAASCACEVFMAPELGHMNFGCLRNLIAKSIVHLSDIKSFASFTLSVVRP